MANKSVSSEKVRSERAGGGTTHPSLLTPHSPKVRIQSREDADLALRELGRIGDRLAVIEVERVAKHRLATDEARVQASDLLTWRAAIEKELERWAEEDRDEDRDREKKAWSGKTLALNFGRLFFRESTGAILLKRSKEYVLNRLKARRLWNCIRKIEEPDKDALKALDDAALKEIGCKREKPEYFRDEVFRPEVK